MTEGPIELPDFSDYQAVREYYDTHDVVEEIRRAVRVDATEDEPPFTGLMNYVVQLPFDVFETIKREAQAQGTTAGKWMADAIAIKLAADLHNR